MVTISDYICTRMCLYMLIICEDVVTIDMCLCMVLVAICAVFHWLRIYQMYCVCICADIMQSCMLVSLFISYNITTSWVACPGLLIVHCLFVLGYWPHSILSICHLFCYCMYLVLHALHCFIMSYVYLSAHSV